MRAGRAQVSAFALGVRPAAAPKQRPRTEGTRCGSPRVTRSRTASPSSREEGATSRRHLDLARVPASCSQPQDARRGLSAPAPRRRCLIEVSRASHSTRRTALEDHGPRQLGGAGGPRAPGAARGRPDARLLPDSTSPVGATVPVGSRRGALEALVEHSTPPCGRGEPGRRAVLVRSQRGCTSPPGRSRACTARSVRLGELVSFTCSTRSSRAAVP